MIVEHEIIEQLESEDRGRSLSWVCALLRSLGKHDELQTLLHMWQAGYLLFLDEDGNEHPRFVVENVLKGRESTARVWVTSTDAGTRWVHS